MYLMIDGDANQTHYEQLSGLTVTSEADLTLATLPVNSFKTDIMTGDDIPAGSYVRLYDESDRLWAHYRVTKSDRISPERLHIIAESELAVMDAWKMGAQMYAHERLSDAVQGIMDELQVSGRKFAVSIATDSYLRNTYLTGFCPEQTARARLQWLCLAAGAFIRQHYLECMLIFPSYDVYPSLVASSGRLIRADRTFWRPGVTKREKIESLTVTGYGNFTTGSGWDYEYSGTDAGGTTWYWDSTAMGYINGADTGEEGHDVRIDGVTLINASGTAQTLNLLSKAYFRRYEIRMDVLNPDREWYPGMKVRVYVAPETIVTAYIRSMTTTFGVRPRTAMVLESDMVPVDIGTIEIADMYGDDVLGVRRYTWPDGEDYSIDSPASIQRGGARYVPKTSGDCRRIGTFEPDITGIAQLSVDYRLAN